MLKKSLLALLIAGLLPAQAAITWSSGLLGPNQKVADNLLQPLSIGFGGYPIWKSNNPEIFRGTGWLMQNARADASRGGSSSPLSGCHNAYLFHINQRGAAATLHLIATNPNNATITLSAKGSMVTNSQKPLTGKATGQSYAVSKDWLNGSFGTNFTGRSVGAFQGTEIAKLAMNNSNMLDGRFEVCASAPIYLYSVVTGGGSTTDAINLSQGAPAVGDIKSEAANAYGREAGVYASSLIAGTTVIDLPAGGNLHAGFALNTSAKFNANLQEQTSAALYRLSDSSTRSYGNYGHKLDVTLRLRNPACHGEDGARLLWLQLHEQRRHAELHLQQRGNAERCGDHALDHAYPAPPDAGQLQRAGQWHGRCAPDQLRGRPGRRQPAADRRTALSSLRVPAEARNASRRLGSRACKTGERARALRKPRAWMRCAAAPRPPRPRRRSSMPSWR